jgi:hypothetical protein
MSVILVGFLLRARQFACTRPRVNREFGENVAPGWLFGIFFLEMSGVVQVRENRELYVSKWETIPHCP